MQQMLAQFVHQVTSQVQLRWGVNLNCYFSPNNNLFNYPVSFIALSLILNKYN